VSGNIGSGKSTLTGILAERFTLQPVYEAVEENPYLEDFYRDMKVYAFHSQMFFLARRIRQHVTHINGPTRVIQDRTIHEDVNIFAANLRRTGLLSERDHGTYQEVYEAVRSTLRPPDLLLYIRCSLPTLRERIATRGRDFERRISDEYLMALNGLYEEWIEGYDTSPCLVLDGDRLDFVHRPDALEEVLTLVEGEGVAPPALF
jgi:deoxyadenosine/deoxycytidine kinase